MHSCSITRRFTYTNINVVDVTVARRCFHSNILDTFHSPSLVLFQRRKGRSIWPWGRKRWEVAAGNEGLEESCLHRVIITAIGEIPSHQDSQTNWILAVGVVPVPHISKVRLAKASWSIFPL